MYPELHATIYCSYEEGKPVEQFLQDSYKLVDRQQRIQDMQEKVFENPEKQVYGSLFLLKGDCISPIQFHLTDSTGHFSEAPCITHSNRKPIPLLRLPNI